MPAPTSKGSKGPKVPKPKQRRRANVRHAKWDRAQYLVDALGHMEEIAEGAHIKESWQAAVRGKQAATQIREELDRMRELEAIESQPDTIEAQRSALLGRVRRLAFKAESDRSYVAAGTFLKLELDLLDVEKEKEDKRKQEQLEGVPDDTIIETFLGIILELPPKLQKRIAYEVGLRQAAEAASDPGDDAAAEEVDSQDDEGDLGEE